MYDESEPEPIVAPDTDNHTRFYWNDPMAAYQAESRLDGSRKFKNHYHRLFKHNLDVIGKWNNQEKKRRGDNLAILDAVANFLELPEYQHRIARHQYERVPLKVWSSPNGIDAIISAVMICAVVCLKDPRFHREYNPDRNDESQDELFLQLLERLSYRESVIRSCYQKALAHVDWEPVDWADYKRE